MFRITFKICVDRDREDELVQTIRSIFPGLEREQGHLDHGVYRDVEKQGCFVVLQQWQTREALDAYLRTDTFGVLLGALNVLADSWDANLDAVSHSEGQEAIVAARAS